MRPKIVVATVLVFLFLLNVPSWAKGMNSSNVQPSTRTQLVTADHFQHALIKYFRPHLKTGDVDLSIHVLFPKQGIKVPAGQMTIHIPPDNLGGRTGRRSFRMGIHVGSRWTKTVNVVASVAAQTKVVSPNRWIKAHETLQPGDVISLQTSLDRLNHEYVVDLQDVIGKEAKRPLPPNKPLRHSSLSLPPVIQKGDRVIIEARRGGLVIQTVGIARASGQHGKTIPVKNQSSGREILGRVIRSGLVEVQF